MDARECQAQRVSAQTSKSNMSKVKHCKIILDAKTMDALEEIAEAPNPPEGVFTAADLSREDWERVVHLLPPLQSRMLEEYLSREDVIEVAQVPDIPGVEGFPQRVV